MIAVRPPSRPRPGGDRRGSSRDRRARKLWLLSAFGDGSTCPCAHCQVPLGFDTVEADRIAPGGTYARANIQPACRRCNSARGNRSDWTPPMPPRRIVLSPADVLVIQALGKRGEWLNISQVTERCKDPDSIDVPGTLMSLTRRGIIERDHEGRMVLYRSPAKSPR